MKPITQEWIDKAEGDYRAAQTLWGDPKPVYEAICFHAQQCAEKCLKAWLIEQNVNFPKAHDLEALAKLCIPSLPELAAQLNDLRFLTSFAVEIRYPGTVAQESDAR